MQDAFLFLKAHCVPPKPDDRDNAVLWWQQAAHDADRIACDKWHGHRLADHVLIAILNYLEEKSKEGKNAQSL